MIRPGPRRSEEIQHVPSGRTFLEQPVQVGAPRAAVGGDASFRAALDLEQRVRALARRVPMWIS